MLRVPLFLYLLTLQLKLKLKLRLLSVNIITLYRNCIVPLK